MTEDEPHTGKALCPSASTTHKYKETPVGQQVHTTNDQPTVGQNVTDQLKTLRIDLDRTIQDLRVKTKEASAETKTTLESLDREVRRFGAKMVNAEGDTRDDLMKVGKDLRARARKLANEVALPS